MMGLAFLNPSYEQRPRPALYSPSRGALLPCGTTTTNRGLTMIDRRRALRLTLAALPAAAWLASPALAEEAFERLYPFLVDLPGWTGGKPGGVAMSIGSVSIMTASRKYKRDDG